MLAQLIRRTAANLPDNCAKIDTLPVAVGDCHRPAEFLIAQRGRASNALAQFMRPSNQMGGIRERQLVPMMSLDDLLEISPRPAFVKIDVEGAEVAIFQGATRLLTHVRPIIYIEVVEQNCPLVTDQLHSADYDLFDPKLPISSQTPLPKCGWNTLAIPRHPKS